MGKVNLLACLEKRDLLNQPAVSVKQLLEWGARYEEEGLINDAVEFYERANSADHLEKLLPVALEEGDAFLYGRILKALGREAVPREWISLGQRAGELGKDAYALEAFKRGGLEKTEEVETGKDTTG
jgi:hypothetical protein